MEGQTTHVSHTTLTKYAEFIMCSNRVTAAVRMLTHTNKMACYQYLSDAWEITPPHSRGRRDYIISLLTANCAEQTHFCKVYTEVACFKCMSSDVLPFLRHIYTQSFNLF